ncbi:hypothetical protein F750_7100 (plasmid) [Streptomyces sp. PAMC 26508]|nr:hypothetical protein F750_7100 [Streptomyces sp. PAMC 26508]
MNIVTVGGVTCSPRPRGWSRRDHERHPRTGVLPAPAGMVPAGP